MQKISKRGKGVRYDATDETTNYDSTLSSKSSASKACAKVNRLHSCENAEEGQMCRIVLRFMPLLVDRLPRNQVEHVEKPLQTWFSNGDSRGWVELIPK